MMRWHRLCAIISAILLVYVVATGLGIQIADLRALVTQAPETDPDMLMMRQHIYGPPNYAVVSAPDYTAPSLPADLDYGAAIRRAAALGHAAAPGQELRLVELRTADGKLAAHVQMGTRQLIFDLATGARLSAAALPPPQPGRGFSAPRANFKFLHRFNYLGGIGPTINGLAAIALAIMIFTGLMHYLRLYRARAKMGRTAPFWRGGDWWRKLHRWTSIAACVPVIWLTLSGLALSIDNTGAFIHGLTSGPRPAGAFEGDQSSPISYAALPGMTEKTLTAYRSQQPGTGVKVLRLRYFAGYPQGVVVAADPATSQYVFNAETGAPMAMWEKGYPDLSFPSGWEWHQRMKQIHRGDILGMPGRWLDLAGGLSLLYLILSGMVMYWQLWLRRTRAGRAALIWR